MGFLSAGQPDLAPQYAAAAATDGMKDAGNGYSNYRQYNRDNNANQLSNESSLYQGYMNRLASAYGNQGSPNVSQMGNNPMSLAQTTVGATKGSNAAGRGVDQYGGYGYALDANGQKTGAIDPNAYGLIGNMGLHAKGGWDPGPNDPNGFHPGGDGTAMDMNGNKFAGMGIYTDPSTFQNPGPGQTPSAPTPAGQFSFSPRRA